MYHKKVSVCAIPLFHPLQDSDDAIDFGSNAKQSLNHLFTLQGISLAERYAEARLSVVLDLCPKRNKLPVIVGSRQHNIQPLNFPVFMLEFHAIDSSDREHWDQKMVFVVDVELVEGSNISIPSSVRFHAIHDEVEEYMRGWYFSAHSGLKIPSFLLGVNRELAEPGIDFRNEGAVSGTPRNIERAVEIVDSISHRERDFPRQLAVSKMVVEELFPRLRVDVQAGAVTVGRSEDSLLNICDVLIGPLNFQRGIAEWVLPKFAHE